MSNCFKYILQPHCDTCLFVLSTTSLAIYRLNICVWSRVIKPTSEVDLMSVLQRNKIYTKQMMLLSPVSYLIDSELLFYAAYHTEISDVWFMVDASDIIILFLAHIQCTWPKFQSNTSNYVIGISFYEDGYRCMMASLNTLIPSLKKPTSFIIVSCEGGLWKL